MVSHARTLRTHRARSASLTSAPPLAFPAEGSIVICKPRAGFTWDTVVTEKDLIRVKAACVGTAWRSAA